MNSNTRQMVPLDGPLSQWSTSARRLRLLAAALLVGCASLGGGCGESTTIISGQPGPAGATGATGAAGTEGATGDTGSKGTAGASGATGASGAEGAKGAAGAPGDTNVVVVPVTGK